MADNDKNNDFTPEVEERDDEYIFKLRDDVYISVRFASEKKLRFQMWRKDVILPPDEGNPFSPNFRKYLVKQAKEAFNTDPNKELVPHIETDVDKMCTMLGTRGDSGKSIQEKLVEDEGGSLTERLIHIAEQNAVLFKTPYNQPHAACQQGDHTEVLLIDSPEFRTWLRGLWRRKEKERLEEVAREERARLTQIMGAMADEHLRGAPIHVPKPPLIHPSALATVVQEIMATALLDGATEEVHLRVASHGPNVYVDLCNEKWEAVEVRPDGWDVIFSADLPVRFGRSNAMGALPYPERGGSLGDLKRIVNFPDHMAEEAWALIGAWLVQALAPCAGDYPILVLLGAHGTAKTTLVEFFRMLVDPAEVLHEHEKTYHDLKTLYIELVGSRVLAIDNVTSLPGWLSDTLCRISSGAGFKPRKLFTDRDQEIFKAKRPIILDGIAEVVRKSDILNRTILVDLPPIPGSRRRYEEELWAEFEDVRASVLGALLDATAAGLKGKAAVHLKDDEKSRLADFDRWAVATETALGTPKGTYLKARKLSREHATTNALENHPCWVQIYNLAHRHKADAPWNGTMKKLLGEITDAEDDDALKRSRDWPKTPEKLKVIIKELSGPLLERGVHIDKDEQGSTRRGQPYNVYGMGTEPE